MINDIQAAWFPPGLPELMLIGCWLLVIILPVLYVVRSIKKRREILTELEKLNEEVRSLRQEVKGNHKASAQNKG